jgi:type VII secretion integral membrane protein EccD
MSSDTTTDTCRLTVVAPSSWADVALPVHVPLADLVPVLVRKADPQLADAGVTHGGWVLQRLGEGPLDEDSTPADLGLLDGETVYLRPRESAIPEYDFDDLIDGVAAGIRERTGRWRQAMTRWLFLGLVMGALALGVAALVQGGPTGPRAVTAGLATALLLFAGMAASRALGDAVAGVLLGLAALPYAALDGMLPVPGPSLLSAPHLLAGSAVTLVVAALALAAVGAGGPWFVAAILASLLACLGTGVTTWFGLTAAQGATVAVTLALVLCPLVPGLAFRLAKLRVPAIPGGRADLNVDTDPVPAEQLLARTPVVDRYATGLFGAVGAVAVVCMALLASDPRAFQVVLIGLVAGILLLRSRVLVSARQRLATSVPALVGLVPLLLGWLDAAGPALRLNVTLGLVGLAGMFLAAAHTLPGRRLLPYWGRAAEIIESVAAVAMVPVVLAILDVYQWARSLAG